MSCPWPARRRSTGCTGCCWSSSPAARSGSCPPPQAKALLASVAPADMAGRVRHRLAAELVDRDRRVGPQAQRLRQAAAQGGHGHRHRPARPVRHRPRRRGPHPRRCRRRGPIRHPGPVRQLERHRTPGRLQRRTEAPSALPRRQPANQPGTSHHGHRADPPRHRRPRLLSAPPGRGQDADRSVARLKRRLSDVVYRQLVADAAKASPGGHTGATTTSSAADPTPRSTLRTSHNPGSAPSLRRPCTTTTTAPARAWATRPIPPAPHLPHASARETPRPHAQPGKPGGLAVPSSPKLSLDRGAKVGWMVDGRGRTRASRQESAPRAKRR